MTDPPALGTGALLDFNAPLSGERADRLVRDLATRGPDTVLDVGCGWGELLLRITAATPGARATGVDIHGPDLARARRNAAARGLAARVTFIEGPAADHLSSADLVLNLGAYQAFGGLSEALRALRELVTPGGRLLFGAEFWERTPTHDELANMWPGITAGDCTDVAGLVDRATAEGFRPVRIETANSDEWAEFESGSTSEVEEWLAVNPDHPEADVLRAKVDAQRAIWLRGHRGVMGFAYLTLAAPAR